jgi:Berberine and berberine like
MPYVALQTMLDASAVPGRRYYMRSNFLDDLSPALIERLQEGDMRTPSPLSAVIIVSMGGAVSRVANEATAYYHRDVAHTMTVISGWPERGADAANVSWVKEVWRSLEPQLDNRVYVNELHDEGAERIRGAYGPTYARLAALKRRYDPDNVFRLNQNIQPA